MIAKLLRISCKFEKKITKARRAQKIVEIKKRGEREREMGEKWSCYFWRAIVLRNFIPTRTACYENGRGRGRRNPHTYTYITSHKSIYLYLLFRGGVRAQLTSLRESRLTCFATIIQPFQIQCSFPLPPSPRCPVLPHCHP